MTRRPTATLVALFLAALTLRPQIVGVGPLIPEIQDSLGTSHAVVGLLGTIPVLCDPDGRPILRNFVHVEDLVSALLAAVDHPQARRQTFNICMDEPVDYRAVAKHLAATRGLPSVDIRTPFHSTWLDNAKARFLLGWRPRYDLARLIDDAWDYQRSADDPRKVWYPG